MRTASILVFLAHSVPILSGNLNSEGKEKTSTQIKKHQTFVSVFQNLKKSISFEVGFNFRKDEAMFLVLSSVVCLFLLPVSYIPKKKYQSAQLPNLEVTIHLKIGMHATPRKIWASHKQLCFFLVTSEYQIPKNKGINQNF